MFLIYDIIKGALTMGWDYPQDHCGSLTIEYYYMLYLWIIYNYYLDVNYLLEV